MSARLPGIHECGLVLRTVETPAITAGQAVVGNQRRLSGWGSSRLCHTQVFLLDHCCAQPQSTGARSREPSPGFLSFLLPPSVLWVTPVGPCPVFAFLFRLYSACVVCLGPLLPYFSILLLAFPCHLPCPIPPCSLSHPTPAIIFSSVPPRSHFLPAFPQLGFIHQLFHIAKEKKKGGSPPTKKPKQKLILSVFRSAASSWWPVCPCGLQPARPPYPSAVCPARPPARLALPANDTEFSAWVFGDGL